MGGKWKYPPPKIVQTWDLSFTIKDWFSGEGYLSSQKETQTDILFKTIPEDHEHRYPCPWSRFSETCHRCRTPGICPVGPIWWRSPRWYDLDKYNSLVLLIMLEWVFQIFCQCLINLIFPMWSLYWRNNLDTQES